MLFRRNGNYYEPGDIFASVVMILIILGLLAVMAVYIGYIILIIVACLAVAVGLGYALYVYIKNFVLVAKSLRNVNGKTKIRTFFLRWFVLMKDTSKLAFVENFNVAKSAITRSHAYKTLSPKKWFWLLIAPATLILGTLFIAFVIVAQLVLIFYVACFLLYLLLFICFLLFVAALIYAFIMTFRNFPAAFSGKSLVFKEFNFTRMATISDVQPSIRMYYKTLYTYIKGIWDENLASAQNNKGMAAGCKLFSIKRYFLYVSIGALFFVAALIDALICVGLSIVFVFELLANLIWIFIVKIFIR